MKPKNLSLPDFRQWLTRNFEFCELHDYLDALLDSHKNGRYNRYGHISTHIENKYLLNEKTVIDCVYFSMGDNTFRMGFEMTDSHYYAYYEDK